MYRTSTQSDNKTYEIDPKDRTPDALLAQLAQKPTERSLGPLQYSYLTKCTLRKHNHSHLFSVKKKKRTVLLAPSKPFIRILAELVMFRVKSIRSEKSTSISRKGKKKQHVMHRGNSRYKMDICNSSNYSYMCVVVSPLVTK